MGDFPRHDVQSTHKQDVRLTGGFAFNAASAPSTLFGNIISSVAHTSTGIWTVTLKSQFQNLDLIARFGPFASLASSADVTLHFGPYDASAGTLVIRNLTGGSLADVAAATDNYCFFELVARYGGVAEGVTYDS